MSLPFPSDGELRVIHTLRCVGVSGAARLADAVGLPVGDVQRHLDSLSVRGLVALDESPFGGWGVTEAGRAAEQMMVDEELVASASRADLSDAYEVFLGLNQTLLDVCGDWQMRKIGSSPVLNDHSDSGYDNRVLTRLMRVDESAQEVCARLSERLSRFAPYGPRLSSALDKAVAGRVEYVADHLESYHSIWFQLHEDLLTTLGITREAERGRFSGGGG